jgi:acetyltransferase-like isoleucine patch superfamily enzyme
VRLGRETQILGRLTLLGGTNVPGGLEVGDEAALDCPCTIDLAAPVRIGHRVNIGRETLILTGTHAIGALTRRCGPDRAEPVAIGDGTWVGARVTILPGVTIGAGCVVAAGAVVTRSMPPNSVVAGNPARVVGRANEEGSLPLTSAG